MFYMSANCLVDPKDWSFSRRSVSCTAGAKEHKCAERLVSVNQAKRGSFAHNFLAALPVRCPVPHLPQQACCLHSYHLCQLFFIPL